MQNDDIQLGTSSSSQTANAQKNAVPKPPMLNTTSNAAPAPNSSPKKYNPLYDPATDNLPIDERVQKDVINTPAVDPTGVNPDNQAFLEKIVNMIDTGKINVLKPSSIINDQAYSQLSEEAQGKVDMESINMLASIRQIHGLYKTGYSQSYQIQNLVHHLRLLKERLEGVSGDVFII
ncbi:hypothetical protein HYV57_02250 [Candidatus Peregrinibacteria bacterium]|nr:hypothetical protein [Candidatus Peregrinibacteria bacterium]